MVAMELNTDSLAAVLTQKLEAPVMAVMPFEARTTHTMYSAEWHQPDGTLPVIVRMFGGPRRIDEARSEASALHELHRLSYPAPELFLIQEDESLLGQPFIVMERLPGQPLGSFALAEPERIPYWIDKASNMLLKLHGLDWKHSFYINTPEIEPFAYADRHLNWWTQQAKRFGVSTALEGFTWLRSNVVMTRRAKTLSLIHRDFHPNNILALDGRITGVVDWGELTVGDPSIDVGWTHMILATEAGTALGESFVNFYRRHNPTVLATLPFWEVFAACKRLTVLAGMKESTSVSPIPVNPDVTEHVVEFMRQRLTEDD
jgi:aminoglycoside phosphotransferase (APT) family kinase protein